MDQAEVQQLFRRFAEPLAEYVLLGARKESAEALARNLWAALIGGEEVEKETWHAIEQTGGIDANLLHSVRACYENEMKPKISANELAMVRARYGISD